MSPAQLWHRAFLEKRPSLSLGLFRVAVAFTVGCHMIPSFFHMEDNYLSTAFKTKNFSFFPIWILRLVERSPDGVVWTFVLLFYVSLATFALGLFSQASCILMTLSCYYFYALNNYHIGTLSFDILLVTLFLMCVTNAHGDFLSLDSLRRGKDGMHKRLRPYCLQRLLQLQLAWTFWYTALSKISAGGNWLTDNPYYYLMHYPPIGVVRDFPLRAWLGQHPTLCYGFGVALIVFEFTLPLLWFIPRTRLFSIALGIVFQLMLWVTLHVPTIFLFLFPPMMLLFIQPETLVRWIEKRQAVHAARGRAVLLYDGQCGFCLESVKRLRILDLFGWVDPLDFHAQPDLSRLHPSLTPERCHSEMVLLEPNGRLSGGFQAFARLTLRLPSLMWLAPLVHVPGAEWVGTRIYQWVASHRYLLHRNAMCQTNQCAVLGSGNGSSKI
jgi:predicted DCC family thiol-disulfide oxidoreductase YuxK